LAPRHGNALPSVDSIAGRDNGTLSIGATGGIAQLTA
jgi:hypothetical protein